MRHITYEKIEAEISARNYKRLCEKLKSFNRKQLWKVLDSYIFHIMEDAHVDELTKILESFEQTGTPVEASNVHMYELPDVGGRPVEYVPAATANVKANMQEDRRMIFHDVITEKDMHSSKSRMDLMYDVTYFTRLPLEVAVENAKRLIAFAEKEQVLAQPHWHFIAAGEDFYAEEDEEEQ